MTHPYDREKARVELAAQQRLLPVPPGHWWTTRRTRVVLLRVIGPRFAEIRADAEAPPRPVQVVSIRQRALSPSRVVLRCGDGSTLALHVLLPGEASPAQIGHARTKPLPQWMVFSDVGGDALDGLLIALASVVRLGYNLTHLPTILQRHARRRAAAAEVVAALS